MGRAWPEDAAGRRMRLAGPRSRPSRPRDCLALQLLGSGDCQIEDAAAIGAIELGPAEIVERQRALRALTFALGPARFSRRHAFLTDKLHRL